MLSTDTISANECYRHHSWSATSSHSGAISSPTSCPCISIIKRCWHRLNNHHPSLCFVRCSIVLPIVHHFAPNDRSLDSYVCHPDISPGLYQQSMTSSRASTSSLPSSTPGTNISLTTILTPRVNTPMTLLPIELPTPLSSVPPLSITKLIHLAENFNTHNYVAWTSSFEIFLDSHRLPHRLTMTLHYSTTCLMPLDCKMTCPLSLGA